jgi:ribosomal protein S12 methylthiotransferase
MKIGLISLGCPKNLVDSEVMLGLAQQDGHEVTADASEAEVLVVNTCAFIDRAKQESIDTILELAEHKKAGTCQTLVVTGCLAERYRDELQAQIPEIDVVLGTGEVPAFAGVLGGAGASRSAPMPLIQLRDGDGREVRSSHTLSGARADARLKPGATPDLARLKPGATTDLAQLKPGATTDLARLKPGATTDPTPLKPGTTTQLKPGATSPAVATLPTYLYDADTPRVLATPRHYAYLKIAEGCNYTCAFCIIPTLRGRYRSRTVESVVREAEGLAARGVKELLLVSQDTSFYGVDRHDRGRLASLLRALDRVDGIEWIRMLYLYPTTIGDDLLDAMAESRKVCRYIDLPLQHASAAVLQRMRRPGSRASYERLLDRIRTRLPGVALRTTFIVGFPGETDADVAELQSFVAAVEFDHLGVFTYSHEEGTSAHGFIDDVPAAVKRRRQRQLMSQQRRIVARAQARTVGRQVRLLVDGPDPEHPLVWRGRLETQAPDIDPVVYLTECDPSTVAAGQFLRAEVVASRGYDLVARPAASCRLQ